MTARTWRISPHLDHPYTRLDQLAILANVRITRDRLRIPCPAHGGTNPNLELKVADDRISATCFSQGCSYRDIAQATLAKFGISIGRGHNEEKTLARTERRPASPKRVHHDLRTYALKLWRLSIPIPKYSDHPARQWLDARQLWRPDLSPPGSGLSQIRRPGRRNGQPPRAGLLGQSPGTDGPVRCHAGLRPDAVRRHTPVLGAYPLHPPGGRPGRGRHHLARRPDQVLRGPGRLGEGDPAGQRDHHDAPGEEGEGGQGGRQHSRPKRHCQAGQG